MIDIGSNDNSVIPTIDKIGMANTDHITTYLLRSHLSLTNSLNTLYLSKSLQLIVGIGDCVGFRGHIFSHFLINKLHLVPLRCMLGSR